MRIPSRRADDADLIRARLRVLLDEGHRAGGWLPDGLPGAPSDDLLEDTTVPRAVPSLPPARSVSSPSGAERTDAGLPAGIGRHRAPGSAVRVAPSRSSFRALVVAGALGALVLVGGTVLDRPRAEPVDDLPAGASATEPAPATPAVGTAADTAATVTVAVVGRVAQPGLVVLPGGSRVADAIAAAGGLQPEADPATVNLAALLVDGQQIAVGVPAQPGAVPSGAAPPGAVPAGNGRIPLNSATAADLDALPGIGPVLAQRIVEHRERHGPFTTVEQLEDVPGIGPAILDEIADLVAV